MPKREIIPDNENGDVIPDEDIVKAAPEMDYRDAINQYDHNEAFRLYFRIRNLSSVAEKMDIPKSTIHLWRKKYDWDKRIREIEEKSRVKVDKSLEAMNSFHQNIYKFLQARAFAEIREGDYQICPKCKNKVDVCPVCDSPLPKRLQFKSMNEIIKVLDTAIKGERLVSGLTTSNVGVQVIQSLSDEYSERLGVALGRLVREQIITDFIFAKIIHEFSVVMNEKPISVASLKSANPVDVDKIPDEL